MNQVSETNFKKSKNRLLFVIGIVLFSIASVFMVYLLVWQSKTHTRQVYNHDGDDGIMGDSSNTLYADKNKPKEVLTFYDFANNSADFRLFLESDSDLADLLSERHIITEYIGAMTDEDNSQFPSGVEVGIEKLQRYLPFTMQWIQKRKGNSVVKPSGLDDAIRGLQSENSKKSQYSLLEICLTHIYSIEPEHRYPELLKIHRLSRDHLKDYTLYGLIAEEAIMPMLLEGVIANKHRDAYLAACAAGLNLGKRNQAAIRFYRWRIDTSTDSNEADASRVRLAEVFKRLGEYSNAIKTLEEIDDKSSLRGAKEMIPNLRSKTQSFPLEIMQ